MKDFELMPFAPGELRGLSISLLDSAVDLNAGKPVRISVSVANCSDVTIGGYRWWHPFPLFLGYIWTELITGSTLPQDNLFTEFWTPLAPGQHQTFHMRVRAPQMTGSYTLSMLLYQGGICRWYDRTSEVQPIQVDVEVTEAQTSLPHSINNYEQSIYSQNGEDGILKELFLRLGYINPFTVEFGVGTGMESISAYWLRQYRWRGLLIEADTKDFARLTHNYEKYPGVSLANTYVSVENIVDVFRRYDVPREFDLLSIDVDGNDYWLWQAVADYRPRVAVVEINRSFTPPQLWVMAYNENHVWNPNKNRHYHGASLESLARLGTRLGYALVGTDSNDINAFFVRYDLLQQSGFTELSPTDAYHGNPTRWPPGLEFKCDGPYVRQ